MKIGNRESGIGNRPKRLLSVVGILTIALSACREHGRPDPQVQMAPSHERSAPAPEDQPGRSQVPARLEIPPEVQKAYEGIRIHWKETGGGEGAIDVPLGGSAKIPGSNLEVKSDAYLPAFSMAADRITSTGTAEENPAARVIVSENGKDLFAGWIFKRFPDVHPFQHPKYSIRLEGGVRRRT